MNPPADAGLSTTGQFASVLASRGDLDVELEDRLRVIEERLLAAASVDTRLVTDAARWIINAGGKRFRPVLAVLAAQFGPDPRTDDVVTAALVVELTHVASLYHDDVMDDADKRRDALTAHQKWQNSVAIMVGDFLFSRASSLVAELGPEAVRIQADNYRGAKQRL